MRIKLKRNSWHRRLQEYVLDIPSDNTFDMQNLCPYFWLTVFCLLALPFVFTYRVLRFIFRKFMKGMDNVYDYLAKKFIDPYLDRWLLAADSEIFWKKINRNCRYFYRWQELHGDRWPSLYRQYREEAEILRIKQERDLERKKEKRMKTALWLASCTQRSAPLIGILLLAGMGSAAYWFGGLLGWETVFKILTVMGRILLVLIGLGISALLVVGTVFAVDKIKHWYRSRYRVLNIAESPRFNPFRWVFMKVILPPFEILIEYIKASKENYCPAITWEDQEKK